MEMTRGLSSEMLAALDGPFHPVLMAHMDWPAAPVWAHSGVGDIEWAGQIWRGVGPLGNVSIPAEQMGGVVSSEAIVSLIGVPADLDGLMDDAIRNRPVEILLAVVAARPGEAGGTQLIGTPVSMFAGTMDGLALDAQAVEDGVEHAAQVTVTTGPSARSMASLFHCHEDQARRHPGDTAGRLVILSVAKGQKLTWPES